MDYPPSRRGLLKANVETHTIPDEPEGRQWRRAMSWVRAIIVGGALLAALLVGILGVWIVLGAMAPPTRAASTDPGCIEVGARECLSVDPRLRPAITLLQTTTKGGSLLKTAADANVSVRIGVPPVGALAYFRASTKGVTLGERLTGSSARAQAAVLAHELQHVSDWTKVGRMGNNSFNCYQTEASAFTTEAGVWKELRGSEPPVDGVERNIEAVARGVDSGQPKFWLGLASDYLDECVGG